MSFPECLQVPANEMSVFYSCGIATKSTQLVIRPQLSEGFAWPQDVFQRQKLWVSAGGGGGIGQTGQPSASPLPSVPFSIPATLALPLPGTDKVQLEADTSCNCAHSLQTPQDTGRQLHLRGAPSWNLCPALD